MQGEAFSELPYMPKDRSSKRNSLVIHLLPWSFINQERWTHLRRGDQKVIPYPAKLHHKPSYLLPVLLKAHSSFLKTIYSPLRGLPPTPLSLLGWHVILNSKGLGESLSFPSISHVYVWYTC